MTMDATILTALKAVSFAASKPVNDALEAAMQKGSASPPVSASEPAETLNRIALDEELEKALAPMLQQLGFKVGAEEILDQLTNSRMVSIATRQESRFYMVCIPKTILEQPGPKNENLGAVALLTYVFAKNSLLYIFSRELSAMYLSFETMMEGWSDIWGIKAIFIPWPHVTKFLGENNEQVRIQLVRQMLKLDKLVGPPKVQPAAPATPLTPNEQAEAVRIIVQQADDPFLEKPQDYFNDLVATADLPEPARFAGRWKGDPDADARLLLRAAWMFKYPNGHARAGQNTLGWVLKAVLGKQPLSLEDSHIIVKIIVSHNLISDPETLQALRVQDSAIETR